MQLPSQINIYSLVEGEGVHKFQLTDRLRRKFECNLLVVCSKHVILCQERRLQTYTFDGQKERYDGREMCARCTMSRCSTSNYVSPVLSLMVLCKPALLLVCCLMYSFACPHYVGLMLVVIVEAYFVWHLVFSCVVPCYPGLLLVCRLICSFSWSEYAVLTLMSSLERVVCLSIIIYISCPHYVGLSLIVS